MIWISPLDCMANESPSERKSTSVFRASTCALASRRPEFHLPRQRIREGRRRSNPGRRELAFDLDPTRALARWPLAPRRFLERDPRPSGQPVAGEAPADQPGEVDVEELALKIGFPIVRSGLPQVERSRDLGLGPNQSSASKKTLSIRAGNGEPSTVLNDERSLERLGSPIAGQNQLAPRAFSAAGNIDTRASRSARQDRPGTRRPSP